MLLTLGFATSCKEDMPQSTPEPTPVVPETPGTPETPANPTKPTLPVSPAEPMPSVPKPSDYRIATRMVVEPIKEKKAEMLATLKIEDFAWRGNKDAIKLEDLLPFVTFKASDLDGEPYTLTSEDLKQLELVDMKYEEHGSYNDYIAFKVRYSHISGTSVLRIPVSRREYFMQKFEVNKDFAPQYYLGGIAHLFPASAGEILKGYDRAKYAVILTDARADHSNNELSFRGQVYLVGTGIEDPVVVLDFEAKGFKPLSALQGQLTFVTSGELNEHMRDRLKKIQKSKTIADAVVLQLLQNNAKYWIKLASPGIQNTYGGELQWDGDNLEGVLSGGHDTRDIYLEDARFAINSARYDKAAGTVTLGVELIAANGIAVSGVTTTLVVRSVNL
ncbi:hypothetical protein GCM10007088_12430 [Porphyromonas pasteri]|uniref:Lipoprotein n=2 Tax=Porphyromonas pasteri TaxID=1583331 RepID=A0ABQ2H7D5_9PORP|nr:hypothetical protein GCM10007088_12430 [Porphyromonas pasteri]